MTLLLVLACGGPPADAPPAGAPPADAPTPPDAVLAQPEGPATRPADDLVCGDHDGLAGCAVRVDLGDGTALWVQATEALVFQHAACRDAGACTSTRAYSDLERTSGLPAMGLSVDEAARLCAHLRGRLPTDDEFTRLASNLGETTWPWGDGPQCWSDQGVAPLEDEAGVREACGDVLKAIQAARGVAAVDALGALASNLPIERVLAACEAARGLPPDRAEVALHDQLAAASGGVEVARSLEGCARLDPVEVTRTRPGLPIATTQSGRNVGLYGLAGNVAEWVRREPGAALAGGSWVERDPAAWRADARVVFPDGAAPVDAGVRCVWGPE